MKGKVGKNSDTAVKGKMKTRFLVQCIIPATLVLGIVCLLSIYFTRTMACQNMFSALTGQQASKLMVFDANISEILDQSKLDAYSDQFRDASKLQAPDDAVQGRLNELAVKMGQQSSVLQRVSVVSFDRGVTGTSRGEGKAFTGNEYWYDSNKFHEGGIYVAHSPDVTNAEMSLFSFVFPVKEKDGSFIGAFVFGTNDPALIPMILSSLPVSSSPFTHPHSGQCESCIFLTSSPYTCPQSRHLTVAGMILISISAPSAIVPFAT